MKSMMSLYEHIHGFSLVPASSIYIEPDRITFQPFVNVRENVNKAIAVPSLSLDHPKSAQQWSYPSGDIEPLLVLAGRGNPQPLSTLSPSPTQTWVQRKPCFILKNYGLGRSQGFKFFLKPSEIFWRPLSSPASMCSWHASGGTLTGASSSALAVPSALSQTVAVDVLPEWDHPIEPGSIRTPEESGLSDSPILLKALRSIGLVVQALACPLTHLHLRHLRLEPIGSSSCASSPKRRKSIRAAVLLSSEAALLSSSQPTLRESTPPRQANALWSPPAVLALLLS
jgi:hypothetical protein